MLWCDASSTYYIYIYIYIYIWLVLRIHLHVVTLCITDRCRGRLVSVFISFDVGAIDVDGLTRRQVDTLFHFRRNPRGKIRNGAPNSCLMQNSDLSSAAPEVIYRYVLEILVQQF